METQSYYINVGTLSLEVRNITLVNIITSIIENHGLSTYMVDAFEARRYFTW